MTKLESIHAQAQAAANREGKAMVVLNLNRYSPLYVVRSAWDGAEKDGQFVGRVEPQAVEG